MAFDLVRDIGCAHGGSCRNLWKGFEGLRHGVQQMRGCSEEDNGRMKEKGRRFASKHVNETKGFLFCQVVSWTPQLVLPLTRAERCRAPSEAFCGGFSVRLVDFSVNALFLARIESIMKMLRGLVRLQFVSS